MSLGDHRTAGPKRCPDSLCGILNGTKVEESWLSSDGLFDFYDAKGVVEGLLRNLDVTADFETSSDKGLHPSRQAAIVIEDNRMKLRIGIIGELHPKVADTLEFIEPVCMFEINQWLFKSIN